MFNAILLMDLHWGAIPPERMKQELEETLFKRIESMKQLNAIIIGGDLFDSKQYLSSDVTNYVIEFLYNLLDKTEDLGTYIFIIKGTRTHDDLQLQTISTIFENNVYCDFRISVFNRISQLYMMKTIIKGYDKAVWTPIDSGYDEKSIETKSINMLFIPEEYVVDQKEYYKDTIYSDKRYDLIFGHGMIDKIWYARQAKENQNELTQHSSSPVFSVDDLTKSGKYVYFGHIHEHKKYGKDKRFEYVGPFTRWEFGKEGDVGFEYIEYHEDTGVCNEEFIVNEMAQILTTKVINIKEEITLTELNDKINNIVSKEMQVSEKIRFIVNINSSIPNYLSIKDFLISRISELKFAKLVLSVDLDDEVIDDIQEEIDNKNEVVRYKYDTSLELEDRIKIFLKEKRGVDISIEDIKSVLDMTI